MIIKESKYLVEMDLVEKDMTTQKFKRNKYA